MKKRIGDINFKNAEIARQWYEQVAKALATPASQRTLNQQNQYKWYQDNMGNMPNIDRDRIMNYADPFKIFDKDTSVPGIGKMYMYFYDAKHKNTMPFFDIFPLVFPIEYYYDGFLGINLHYLPPVFRAALMNALYDIANNQKFNSTMKLNISYKLLKGSAQKFSGYQECIKRYLYSQVRSNYHYVNPIDWDKALLLPLQKWHINPNRKINPDQKPPW